MFNDAAAAFSNHWDFSLKHFCIAFRLFKKKYKTIMLISVFTLTFHVVSWMMHSDRKEWDHFTPRSTFSDNDINLRIFPLTRTAFIGIMTHLSLT